MTWVWTALVATAVAGLASRFLPRVALEPTTRLWWSMPLAAVLGAGVGLVATSPIIAAALAAVAGLATVMAVVDLAEHRLPDTLIITGLIVWVAGLLIETGATGEWAPFGWAMLAGVVLFVGFFIAALLARGMFGFGDVKLSALLGMVLGWYGWLAVGRGLLFGVVLHGLAAVVVLIITRDKRADVPMGPALIAGAVAALAISA